MRCSILRALLDTEHEGSKPGALVKRIAFAAVGVVYAGLGIAAIHLATGSGTGKSSNASTQDWTQRLLDLPYGVVLVVIAGLVVIAFAASQFKQAYSASFERKLSFDRASEHLRKFVVACGRFGMSARAVVFVEIGIFLIIAAVHHNNKAAKGVGGALAELVKQALWTRTVGSRGCRLSCIRCVFAGGGSLPPHRHYLNTAAHVPGTSTESRRSRPSW